MAPTVPSIEPSLVTAGDTWRWQVSDTTYPAAEGWTLSYAINGVDKLPWSAAYLSSSGDVHTVTIAATATAVLTAGTYELTRIWTGSGGTAGQVFTALVGKLVVQPNPDTAAAGERQSWEERTLAVVEAVLAGKVTADMQMYQIGGRTVSKLPLKDLLDLRSSLRAALSYQRTGSFGQRIRYAFTAPGGSAGMA